MTDFYDSLAFALVLQATAMSVPGQNHFLILSTTQQHVIARMLVVIGIASAGVVFAAGASTAIYYSGQAFSDRIFSALGLIGSCYLLYLGVTLIRRGVQSRGTIAEASGETRVLAPLHAFSSGFLVNLSNAKSVLFFGSIFATTLPLASMSLSAHVLVVAAFFLNSLLVHGLVSALLSAKIARSVITTKRPIILMVSGGVFVTFAILSLMHILAV